MHLQSSINSIYTRCHTYQPTTTHRHIVLTLTILATTPTPQLFGLINATSMLGACRDNLVERGRSLRWAIRSTHTSWRRLGASHPPKVEPLTGRCGLALVAPCATPTPTFFLNVNATCMRSTCSDRLANQEESDEEKRFRSVKKRNPRKIGHSPTKVWPHFLVRLFRRWNRNPNTKPCGSCRCHMKTYRLR